MALLKRFDFFNWWKARKKRFSGEGISPQIQFKYECFKELLNSNIELLNIIARIEEKLKGDQIFGMSFIKSQHVLAIFHTLRMIRRFDDLSGGEYPMLFNIVEEINRKISTELGKRAGEALADFTLPLARIDRDVVDWVGEKAANLGEVANRVNLPVPRGFSITTQAYHALLKHNDLFDEIEKKKAELDPDDVEAVTRVSEEIRAVLLNAEVPPGLDEAIQATYTEVLGRPERASPDELPVSLSLRSSALREDTELSFAGQYQSALNVDPDHLSETYKSIVASLYTTRAMAYRLNRGIRDDDIAMSVCCLEMIDSVASGVMYSRHPARTAGGDVILITAIWGLGPYAVDGTLTPDTYVVDKAEGLRILESRIARKPVQLVNRLDGGLQEIPVPQEWQDAPCLNPEQVEVLARYALKLEAHYGGPQDVEWALDRQGALFVLQTRPLREERREGRFEAPALVGYPILVEKGAVACSGVASGPAFHVRSDEDLKAFPEGAVLIARHSSPQFVIVMSKARAIVTDYGSATGHMASLTREFGIPTLVDAKEATGRIPHGMEVTVDAFSGRVYEGRAEDLLAFQKRKSPTIKDSPVYETLRRVADFIVPLNLLDPRSRDFSPQHCRTIHDIMRFIHELSYKYMFQISDAVSEMGQGALKLKSPVALDLHVIDLGGGLSGAPEDGKTVSMASVTCVPFLALLRGMSDPAVSTREPRPVRLDGFMSVMREQMFSPSQLGERFGDRSYAIIADKYVNFSSRVGYHYGVVDAYCGKTINKNYITFSFKGGAADDVRRNRRARAIGLILKRFDFSVEVLGDRIDARFQKHGRQEIEDRLEVIGRLLQFTRQMDMLMDAEAAVETVARCFSQGDYKMLNRGRDSRSTDR